MRGRALLFVFLLLASAAAVTATDHQTLTDSSGSAQCSEDDRSLSSCEGPDTLYEVRCSSTNDPVCDGRSYECADYTWNCTYGCEDDACRTQPGDTNGGSVASTGVTCEDIGVNTQSSTEGSMRVTASSPEVVDEGEQATFTGTYTITVESQDESEQSNQDFNDGKEITDFWWYDLRLYSSPTEYEICDSGTFDGTVSGEHESTLDCLEEVNGSVAALATIGQTGTGAQTQACTDTSSQAVQTCGADEELVDGECQPIQYGDTAFGNSTIRLEIGGENITYACGTHWETPAEVQEVEACGTVNDTAFRYSCAVNASGWRWFETHKRQQPGSDWYPTKPTPEMTPDNQALWADLTYGVNNSEELNLSDLYDQGISCTDGNINDTVERTAIPSLEQGRCAASQCYAQESCYDQGAPQGAFICQEIDGQTRWGGAVVALANQMLSTLDADSPMLLNCGPNSTTTNYPAQEERGYCELAELDNGISQILIGAVFELEFMSDEFKNQTNRTYPGYTGGEAQPWINESAHPLSDAVSMAWFTSEETGFGESTRSIWDWFTGLFSDDEPAQVPTRTAHQIFYYTQGGATYSASVEYDPERCEEQGNKVIVRDLDGVQDIVCYSDHEWRRMIQIR